MTDDYIREGDIVEIDYITEFAKEHINEGKALVIWKGFNNQPLVRKLDTKGTIWTCYEHIARVVGHIDIVGYMDRSLSAEPCDDCISRQEVINCVTSNEFRYKIVEDIKTLPSVTPKEKTEWIPVSERLPKDLEPVNITWVNHNPENYYADIKDKPFTATGHYCNGRWWWYSVTCQDYLNEYGRCDVDTMDDDIEVIAWMPLPEPYKEVEE